YRGRRAEVAVASVQQQSHHPSAPIRESFPDGKRRRGTWKLQRTRQAMPTDSSQPPQSFPADSPPAVPRYAYVPARAVGAYLPKLTRKAFETFGFSTATLLTEWGMIVGDPLSRYALPEKIKWPRNAGGPDQDEGAARAGSGATLVLRVDPARALDV